MYTLFSKFDHLLLTYNYIFIHIRVYVYIRIYRIRYVYVRNNRKSPMVNKTTFQFKFYKIFYRNV